MITRSPPLNRTGIQRARTGPQVLSVIAPLAAGAHSPSHSTSRARVMATKSWLRASSLRSRSFSEAPASGEREPFTKSRLFPPPWRPPRGCGGRETRRSLSPRCRASSTAYTPVCRICWFRNSTIALSSSGIRSATNSSRICLAVGRPRPSSGTSPPHALRPKRRSATYPLDSPGRPSGSPAHRPSMDRFVPICCVPPPGALKPQSRDQLADLLKCRTSRVGPNLTGADTSSLVRSSGDKRPSAWAGTKPGWTGHGGLAISREGMGRARHGAQRREDDSVNPSAPTAHP